VLAIRVVQHYVAKLDKLQDKLRREIFRLFLARTKDFLEANGGTQ
jgi:hypothetical protein